MRVGLRRSCSGRTSQTWLEAYGYYMPAVVTVPGSRGEIANALRLDVVIDDQFLNCMEVIGASQAKGILMLRIPDDDLQHQATDRGLGVVSSLEELIEVLLHLQELLPSKRGTAMRLADWFFKRDATGPVLPLNPRASRPLPRRQNNW